MQTSPTGSEAGFTLTELLVVLAILALVVSVTPSLYRTAVPGARLKSAAVELLSYLKVARADAALAGEPVVLTISGGTIQPKDGAAEAFEAPSGADISYESAFGGDKMGSALTFYPDGGSSGGTVTLEYGQGTRSLNINWLTGHIAIVR